jgi:hypothetical protein
MEPTNQHTQPLMFSLIETWKGSGQSQIAFCKEKEIAYHRFHYWLKKYNDQKATTAQGVTPSFSQVKVSGASPAWCSIEVVYPDGRKVIFGQPVEVSFLRHLLA